MDESVLEDLGRAFMALGDVYRDALRELGAKLVDCRSPACIEEADERLQKLEEAIEQLRVSLRYLRATTTPGGPLRALT